MRKFKKTISKIILLTSVLLATGGSSPLTTTVYADDYSVSTNSKSSRKTTMSSNATEMRGVRTTSGNGDAGGERYKVYFSVSGEDATSKSSPKLVGIGTSTGIVTPITAGDEGGGNATISYFSPPNTSKKSKNTNAIVKQDELFYQTFYKADDGFWYESKEGDGLVAYRPVKMPSYNLADGRGWTVEDFGGDVDAFQSAQGGSMYFFVPVAVVKEKNGVFDKKGSFPIVSKVAKKEPKKESKTDQKQAQQQSQQANVDRYASQYPSVGDRPSTNTLLAYIMYSKGGSNDDAIKEVTVSFGEVKYYPAKSSDVLTDADSYKNNANVGSYATSGEKGAYIPNSINMATTPQPEGKTLANMLRVYGGWGYISVSASATDTNSTTSNDLGSILSEIWTTNNGIMGFAGNIILTLVSPILWLVGQLLDYFNAVANALLGMITGLVEIFGNPLGILNIVGNSVVGKTGNWLIELAVEVRDYLLSNDMIEFLVSTINSYKHIIFYFWLILGFVSMSYRMVFRKKKYGAVLTKWFFKVSAPFVMILFAVVINGIPTVGDADGYKANEVSDSQIDMLKFGVAFNYDLRKIYDFDSGGQPKWRELVNSDNIDLEDWSLTPEQIKNVNQRIEATLGSELSADLSQNANSSSTFDVNTYLSGIAQASKSSNASLIASSKLPLFNGASYITAQQEEDKTRFSIRANPMLKTSGGSQHSADYIPSGYSFNGYSYIFTKNDASIKQIDNDVATESDESKSTEYAFMSGVSDKGKEGYIKQFSVGYYGLYWKATPLSLSKPWTYLYGANTNNNEITEHPSTYMYGAGESTQVANLRRQQGAKLDDNDKAPEQVEEPKLNGNAYNADELKQYYYWKYINAYNIALINKYMGTASDMDVYDLQLSNQSVVFLLQSQLKENELRYFASNLNHSSSAKGKSGAKTSFIFNRFVTPQKTDEISTMKITGFFMSLAYTMLLVTYIKTIATMSISDYIVGRWKAMFAGFGGSWSNAVYYSVLTWFWGLIGSWIPYAFQWSVSVVMEASKKLSATPIGMAGGFGVGIGVWLVAWAMCYPFVKVADKQISLVVGLIYLLDVLRLAIKGWLFGRFGLDSLIYQGSQGSGFGGLVSMATGGIAGAKNDLKQRLGVGTGAGIGAGIGAGVASSMAGNKPTIGDDEEPEELERTGFNNRPTSQIEGELPDGAEGVQVNGTKKGLSEIDKQRNPLRKLLPVNTTDGKDPLNPLGVEGQPTSGTPVQRSKSPLSKPTTPLSKPTTPLQKLGSGIKKVGGFYGQGARIATTTALASIGMSGLAKSVDKGMTKAMRYGGQLTTPNSQPRQAISRSYEKTKGYVQQFRQTVANSQTGKPKLAKTERGGKTVVQNSKPMVSKLKSDIKPTLTSQELKSSGGVTDRTPIETPKVIPSKEPRVVKKAIKYPKKSRRK